MTRAVKYVVMLLFAIGLQAGSLAFPQRQPTAHEKIEEWFATTCRNSDDAHALNTFKAAVFDLQNCFMKIKQDVEGDYTLQRMLERDDDGAMSTVVSRGCQHVQKFKTCIVDFLSAFEACDAEEDLQIEETKEAITGAIDFACANEGVRIKGAMIEMDMDCLQSNTERISHCTRPLEAVRNKALGILDEEKCRAGKEALFCSTRLVKECGGSATAELIDGVVHIFSTKLPCGEQRGRGGGQATLQRRTSGVAAPAAAPALAAAAAAALALARRFDL